MTVADHTCLLTIALLILTSRPRPCSADKLAPLNHTGQNHHHHTPDELADDSRNQNHHHQTHTHQQQKLQQHHQVNFCPSYSPQFCSCKSETKLDCANFTSAGQLAFNPGYSFNFVRLRPKASVSFNGQINLSGLRVRQPDRFRLHLNNIESFEITTNPFANVSALSPTVIPLSNNGLSNKSSAAASGDTLFNTLIIDNSTFLFLFRGKTFDWYCDLLFNDDTKLRPLFSVFRNIYLGYVSRNAFAEHALCPIVFKNANIDSLNLFNLTLANRLTFIAVNASSCGEEQSLSAKLKSNVRSLHIQSSEVKLDSSLLDRAVFQSLQKLSLEFCNLSAIDEPDLFKPFVQLKEVRFWLFNFEAFIKSAGGENRWMRSLNWNWNVTAAVPMHTAPPDTANPFSSSGSGTSAFDLHQVSAETQMYVEFSDEGGVYRYPDEDFCLFKHFPHESHVFPIIKSSQGLNCTCTMLYLVHNWRHSLTRTVKTNAVSSCFRQGASHTNRLIMDCDFKRRLRKCFADSYELDDVDSRYYMSRGSTLRQSSAGFDRLCLTAAFFLMITVYNF
jgi:hypothetical protein